MKLLSFLSIFFAIVSITDALVQPKPSTTAAGRRAFLTTAATTTAASLMVVVAAAGPAIAVVDPYALDVDDSYKKEAPTAKSGGNGGAVVGGALVAGLALSLPFFYQNIARMAGIKNSKLK